jgi:hypothetical protein
MFNIFKKKQITAIPKTHFEKIKLEICFMDGNKYCSYNQSCTITNESLVQFKTDRDSVYKKYNATIQKIHEDIDSKTSDYVSIDNCNLLIKKSDFLNARIVGEDEDLRKKD